MVADVYLGKVGAVAAREVSRFAHNSRECQQLVEVCRVVDTLLIDQDTVYAPRQGRSADGAADSCYGRGKTKMECRTMFGGRSDGSAVGITTTKRGAKTCMLGLDCLCSFQRAYWPSF